MPNQVSQNVKGATKISKSNLNAINPSDKRLKLAARSPQIDVNRDFNKEHMQMFRNTFELLDMNKDGLISADDINNYYHSLRDERLQQYKSLDLLNLLNVRGQTKIKFAEFTSSLSFLLDPESSYVESKDSRPNDELANVYGYCRLLNTTQSMMEAVDGINALLQSIISSSSIYLDISTSNHYLVISKLVGGRELIAALGFHISSSSKTLLIWRDERNDSHELTAAGGIRIKSIIRQLSCYKLSLYPPFISNLATGNVSFIHIIVIMLILPWTIRKVILYFNERF